MKNFLLLLFALVFVLPAFATVTVSSPAPGSTVTSPAHYVASASTTCAAGVGSMGIYVDNKQVYSSHGAAQINTELSLSPGAQHTVVEEWDKCGGASSATVNLNVSSGSSSTGSGQPGVTVTSPTPNSTVTSPVHYVASTDPGQ